MIAWNVIRIHSSSKLSLTAITKKDSFISSSASLFFAMAQLQVQQLTKRYGNQVVLNNLNFLCSKPILGIAGANGSGKSTLLKCISGLLKPGNGKVTWTLNGRQLTPDKLNGKIGYVAPYIELYESLSVTENIRFIQDLRRNGITGSHKNHTLLLKEFQAEAFSGKAYGDLSTGQRQRVKLAAAMVHNPYILFLDEPGSNLDSQGRSLIESLVNKLSRLGKMIVIASNQADELDLCDEIIDLDTLQ
jgi:ABC-type multidrug transport system ATPase subunit